MRHIFPLLLCALCASPGGAQDAPAAEQPAFEATLCQGWSDRLEPQGATDAFMTDNASVRLVYKSKAPPAAGHTLTPVIVKVLKAGDTTALLPVVRGRPAETNGTSDIFGTGFPLAGRAWAQGGGSFRFRIHWDDDPTPLLDLPFAVSAAKRWALLVGISDYPPAGRSAGDGDLPACDKDAQRMRELLVESFGFQPDQITMVLNLDATAGRIDRELTALAGKVGPDDAVLFYYCGHGTQIPDLDGDEADGWDEALHTADVKPKNMTTEDHLKLVLGDDRIAELLAAFRTTNVTVIFDSCHSGTAVRAGEEEIDAEGFFAGMKRTQGFGRKLVEKAEDADRSNATGVAQGLDIDQRYVFLSAAQSWETGMTNAHGCFFSRELRAALLGANGQSWEQLMGTIRPRVQQSNPGQAPQVTGAMRRYPFSLAEAPTDAPFVRPTVAVVGGWDAKNPGVVGNGAQKGQVALVSGMASLYLESEGVPYDVYPDSDEAQSGSPKGRVVLTGKLQVIQRPNLSPLAYASADVVSGSVARGDRLVPLAVRVPAARPKVGVSFFNNTAKSAIQQMKAVVQAVIGTLRAGGQVNVLTSGNVTTADYIVVPFIKDGEFFANVYTPRSQFVGNCRGPASDIANSIREFVTTRHQQFTRINRMSNTSPSLRLRVVLGGGEGRHKAGTPLAFKGYVDRPAYLYAFVAEEGGGSALVVSTKEPLEPDVPFNWTTNTNAGAKGRLVVKVFATTKPLDTDSIVKAAPDQRADALFAALRKAFPGPGNDRFVGTDGWADESIWVEFE